MISLHGWESNFRSRNYGKIINATWQTLSEKFIITFKIIDHKQQSIFSHQKTEISEKRNYR